MSSSLPPYVDINDPHSKNKEVLRNPAKKISFPLDEETQKILQDLQEKFEKEENCVGLAAPQIGYGVSMFIFEVEMDKELKKFRLDLTDTIPKSIWINPSWTPLTSEMAFDWESCFSVADTDLVGRVPRFTKIAYEAWTPEGEKVEGIAHGFLARAIQHEVDHLNGKLFIDYVAEEDLLTREKFIQLREEEFLEE